MAVRRSRRRQWMALVAGVAGVVGGAAGRAARAADRQWDTDPATAGAQSGDGDWNLTTPNWATAASGGVGNGPWVQDDSAFFGAGPFAFTTRRDVGDFSLTSTRVNITAGVRAASVTFGSGGFLLDASGGNVLTLSGASPTITANADATIVAPIAATSLTKAGGADLFLVNNANAFGPLTVTGGRVGIVNEAALGGTASTPLTLNGGSLLLNKLSNSVGSGFLQFARPIRLGAGGGAVDIPVGGGAALLSADPIVLDDGVPDTAAFTKANHGALYLVRPNAFTGRIAVAGNGGTLEVRGTGDVTAADRITVGQSGFFNVDNNSGLQTGIGGQALYPSLNNNNRVADDVPIHLAGGRLFYLGRNAALSGSSSSETFGTVVLDAGQSEIRADRAGGGGTDLVVSNLTHPSRGGTVRFTAGGTFGGGGDASRIRVTAVEGATLSTTTPTPFLAGYALFNSADFAGYNPSALGSAGGIVAGTYTATTATNDTAPFAAANVVNQAHDVLLPAGNTSVRALRMSGAATRTLAFTDAADTLYVESGGILSDGNNNGRVIGANAALTRGRLTAGPANATGPQDLFLHNNSNTMTIHSVIVDNPNDLAATVAVIKDLDGQVNLEAGTTSTTPNSYSGGTFVYRGTLEARDGGTLGGGAVLVKNARLNLNNRGTIGGGTTVLTVGHTAVDQGEIFLNNNSVAFNASTDRFTVGEGSTLIGPSGTNDRGLNSVSRVATLGGGGQAVLAPGAVVGHTSFFNNADNGVASATVFNTVRDLGDDADVYYGLSGNANAGTEQQVIVGAGTPWRGVSTDRNSRVWQRGTITANGDFYLQGLQRDGGYATLTLGSTTGSLTINNASGAPVRGYVVGNVTFDVQGVDNVASVSPDVTLVVTPGATLLANRANAFGSDTNVPKIVVQGGGTLNLNGGLPDSLNADVTFEAGGQFLADDNLAGGALNNAGGSLNFLARSLIRVDQVNGLLGTQPINVAPGAVARMRASNVLSLGARLGPTPTYEIYEADRTLTSQPAPEDLLVSGATFTNDSNNRSLSGGFGRIVVGPGGVTFAATSLTVFTVNEDFDLGANALTIGSTDSIAGNPKVAPAPPAPAPPLTGTVLTQVSLGAAGSKSLPGATVSVLGNYQLNQGTGNSLPDFARIDLAAGASLRMSQNFQETAGPLSGAGTVVASDGNAKLQIGFGGTDTTPGAANTFAGAFSTTFDPSNTQNASVVKIGDGLQVLTGTSNWNNSLTVNQGELRLAGAAGRTNFGNNYANAGGTLALDNTDAAVSDRLGGNTKQLYMAGGTFRLTGGSGAVTENLSQVRMDAGGYGLLEIVPGAGETRVVAGTLSGRSISAFVLRGARLGAAPGEGVATFVATTPNLFGTAAAGTITTGIRPDILSDTPSAGGTAPLGFVTQDNTTNGFRRLDDATEYATAVTPGASTNNNAAIAAPVVVPDPLAPNAPPTDTQVRSLTLKAGATAITNTDATTLTNARTRFRVDSGGLLVQPGVSTTITTPYLDVNGTHYVHGYGDLAVNGTVLGSGLTKAGPGALALGNNAVPYLSGNISISGGAVTLGPTGNSWYTNTGGSVGASALYMAGGSLDINGNAQVFNLLKSVNNPNTTTGGFVQDLPGAGGNLLNSGAPTSVTVLGNSGSFNGSISGPIDLTKAGGGNLDLTNANPYAGTTTLRGGSLQLRSRGSIANTTAVTLYSGSLFLDNANGLPNASGTYTIDHRMPTDVPVVMRDGVLELRGAPGEFSRQNVAIVTLERSGNFINSNASNSGATELRVGNLVRDPAVGPAVTLSFGGNSLGRLAPTPAAGTPTSMVQDSRTYVANLNGSPLTLDANPATPFTTANGFIGGWAVANSDHFAVYKQSSGVGTPGANFGTPVIDGTPVNNVYPSYVAGTAGNFLTENVVDVTADVTLTAGDKSVGAVRLSGTTNRQLLFTGATATGGPLLYVESGGLIRSNNNNGFNVGTATARGRLTAGLSGGATGVTQNLYVYANANNGNNNFVHSVIVNNPNGDPVRLVKALSGEVNLTAFNTYTGGTVVNGGTLRLAPTVAAGGGPADSVIPGDLTIQDNANVNLTAKDQIRRTANLVVNGGGVLNLSSTAGDVNFLNDVAFNNYGASRTPQVTVQTATTLNLTGNLTSVNDTLAATPAIAAGNTTTSVLDLQGGQRTVTTSGLSPIGLAINASIANGGLVKQGPTMLALGGAASTFTGGVTIDGGQLRVDNPNALGSSTAPGTHAVTANAGTALVINTGTAIPAGVSTTINGATLSPFNNAVTLAGPVALTGNATLAVNDYYQKTTARSLTLNGGISGTGTLTVEASPVSGQNGTLSVTSPTPGQYTGPVTIRPNAIVTAINPNNANTGTPPGTETGNVLTTAAIVMEGGTLNFRDNGTASNTTLAYDNPLVVTGNATVHADRPANVTTPVALTYTNATNLMQLGAVTVGDATLTLNGANGYTFNFSGAMTVTGANAAVNNSVVATVGVLNGSAGANFGKWGTAQLDVISPVGTFTGSTTVGQGTLRVAPGGGGNALGAGAVTVRAGGTLTTDPGADNTVTYNPSSVVNDGLIRVASGTADFGGKFLAASPSLGQQPFSAFAERYTRAADVGDDNNFSNATTGDPYLQFESANNFITPVPGPGRTNTLDQVPLSFLTDTVMNARSGNYTGNDNFGAAWTGTLEVGGAGTLPAGPVSFGTNSDDGSILYVDLDQDHVFEANERVVDNDGLHATASAVGTVTLAAGVYDIGIGFYEAGGGGLMEARYAPGGAVPYASQFVINPNGPVNTPGNVQVDNAATLRAGGLTANTLTVAANGTVALTAAAASSSASVLAITGSSTLNLGEAAGTGNVLTVGALNITTGQTLTKQGAGTLLVNGIGAGAGALSAQAGTVGGVGTIAGAVTIAAGAKLAPGASPGVLTISGALNLQAGSTYAAELAGVTPGNTASNYDQANVTLATGTPLTVTGSTLDVRSINGFNNSDPEQVYFILTQAGTTAVSGTFAGLPEGAPYVSPDGSVTGTITYAAHWTGDQATSLIPTDPGYTAGNDVALYGVTVVPEPAALGGLALAAVGLLARRRRRA